MPRLIMKILRRSGLVVTIITATAIIYLREIHPVYFGACTLVTSLTAKALKLCFRQPRPPQSSKATRTLNYGMPSTHSAAIAFMGTYLLGVCLLRDHVSPLWRVLCVTGCLSGAFSVMWSRVWLGHHTYLQVLAGGATGAAMGVSALLAWTGPSLSVYAQTPAQTTLEISSVSDIIVTLLPYISVTVIKEQGVKEIGRVCENIIWSVVYSI